MCGRLEPGHVCTDFGHSSGTCNSPDARDRLQQLQRLLKRGQPQLDLPLDLVDCLTQEVDVRHDLTDQYEVVRFDVAGECLT
jgi:hypothetical protein